MEAVEMTTARVSKTTYLVGYLGLVLEIAGLVFYFFQPVVTKASLVPITLGSFMILYFMLMEFQYAKRIVTSKVTAYNFYTSLYVLMVLLILVFANWISSRHYIEKDLTENKRYTLSQLSKSVLANLKGPVKLVAFFRDGTSAQQIVRDLIEQYKYQSAFVSCETYDPDRSPGLSKSYEIEGACLVVVRGNDKERIYGEVDESKVTNAIIKLTRDSKKKVYFVDGHGEWSIEPQQKGQSYSEAVKELRNLNYQVEKLTLMNLENVPVDASLLVFAAPEKTLLDNELASLDRYFKKGGKALFLLEPPPTGVSLSGFLKNYGVDVGDNTVVDLNPAQKIFGANPSMPIVIAYGDHAISRPFEGKATMFPLARTVSCAKDIPRGFKVTELLKTTTASWAEAGAILKDTVDYDEGIDTRGPLSLGVAVEMPYTASVELKYQIDTREVKTSTSIHAKAVVLGDAHFASDKGYSFQFNLPFFMSVANWLLEQEDLLAIMPRNAKQATVAINEQQMSNILVFIVFVLPFTIAAVGILVWQRRRERE
jgi:ABC-type uncharacterized transport system involved in gliding motility auxiliary subunit